MKNVWKWILGITLGLVILVGLGFVIFNYFSNGHMLFRIGPSFSGHPMMNDYGFDHRGPMNNFRTFRHPMMGGRGFYPFGGFFFLGGLLRLILPLAVLGAVGYFAYRKGKKDGTTEALAATSQVEPSASDEKS